MRPRPPRLAEKAGPPAMTSTRLVLLARHAITSYVARGAEADPWVLEDPSLPERAGAFVSLHIDGRLRGCIGTIEPTQPTLAMEVAHNAVQAATADPRFPPVTAAEVPLLDVKVDVLHPPQECSFERLDPSRFGVIVSCGWRRGLLLPDLEGVDTAAQQVEIARQKAGIGPSEPCALERFRVDRYT
jgi:MEMO1 family protein